jgi:hypothetical protein
MLGISFTGDEVGVKVVDGRESFLDVRLITSMKDGVKINTRCQVIDNYGDVIPGLYAISARWRAAWWEKGLIWAVSFGRRVG